MEALSDFKSLQDSISQSLVAVTRTANQIASEDLGFYRSLSPAVATALDTQNARLLGLAERLLGNAAANSEVVGPRLPDFDAVDSNWKGIVDVVDSLLEKADTSLDEYTGAVKRLSPSRESVSSYTGRLLVNLSNIIETVATTAQPQKIANALRYATMDKPQLSFQHVPTNAEKEPFKPLLSEKPHAIKNLEDTLQLTDSEDNLPQYITYSSSPELVQPAYCFTDTRIHTRPKLRTTNFHRLSTRKQSHNHTSRSSPPQQRLLTPRRAWRKCSKS